MGDFDLQQARRISREVTVGQLCKWILRSCDEIELLRARLKEAEPPIAAEGLRELLADYTAMRERAEAGEARAMRYRAALEKVLYSRSQAKSGRIAEQALAEGVEANG